MELKGGGVSRSRALILVEQIEQVNGTDDRASGYDDNLPGLFVPEQVVYCPGEHSAAFLNLVAHFGRFCGGLQLQSLWLKQFLIIDWRDDYRYEFVQCSQMKYKVNAIME